MMLSPMKPQTTDGVAARSSTSTFSVSRVLPVANSPMKIAAPRAKGTATSIAKPVTLAVPTIRARAPNWGSGSAIGRQFGEVKK